MDFIYPKLENCSAAAALLLQAAAWHGAILEDARVGCFVTILKSLTIHFLNSW